MKNILKIAALFAVLGLTACGTTSTTTTTKYDTDGNVTEVIESTSDTSDLAAYINAGDGNVTSLNGDISKFTLGYQDIGLKWISISGGRQKAPVNDDSNSAEALEEIAEVVKATKTSIITESVAVNGEPTGSTAEEVTEESVVTEGGEAEGEEQAGETD